MFCLCQSVHRQTPCLRRDHEDRKKSAGSRQQKADCEHETADSRRVRTIIALDDIIHDAPSRSLIHVGLLRPSERDVIVFDSRNFVMEEPR